MKRILSVACLSAFMLTISLFACGNKEPKVIKQSDTYIVVSTFGCEFNIDENTTLVDYMQFLKANGEIEFEIISGMVQSVNGIDNAVDYSSCWMLYTSDEENSSTAWGTVEYKGQVMGSAMFGAETLKLKRDCLYIWVYQAF